MAEILIPKRGTCLTRTSDGEKFTFQFIYMSSGKTYYVVTPNWNSVIERWNYISQGPRFFADIPADDMIPLKLEDGTVVQDDVYYRHRETGVEYRVVGPYQNYDHYAAAGREALTTYVLVAKRGSRVRKNFDRILLSSLEKAEPKVKLNKAQREALEQRNVALEYIFKICVGLGYDSSRLDEATVDKLVDTYNLKSKVDVNKILMEYFDNLPAIQVDFTDKVKDSIKVSKDFKQNDKQLQNLEQGVESIQSALKKVDTYIKNYDEDIANYKRRIEEYERERLRFDTEVRKTHTEALEAAKLKLEEYKKSLAAGKKIDQASIALESLAKAIKDIVEQCGGFYKFHSIVEDVPEIKRLSDLNNILVKFTTNKVYGRDARVAGLTFDAGQFMVEWYPYNGYFRVNGTAYDENFRPYDPDIRVRPFKDNTLIDGYPHPHVRGDGSVCWGEIDGTISRELQFSDVTYEFLGKPHIMFNKIKALLHSYNANSPYKRLVEFAIQKHPDLRDKLPTEFISGRQTVILYNPNAKNTVTNVDGLSKEYYDKVHPVTINGIRNQDGYTLKPDQKNEASHIICKTYIKRFVGVDKIIPKGESNKIYIKTVDNQFVPAN